MAAYDELEAELRGGEALRYHDDLRRGGVAVGLTDDRLLALSDGEAFSVSYDDVVEVTVQDLDWFLTILSVALVGYGVLTLERNVLFGVVAGGIGVASLYRTYSKRGKVTVRARNRPKPLELYPVDTAALQSALRPLMETADDGAAGADGADEVDGADGKSE